MSGSRRAGHCARHDDTLSRVLARTVPVVGALVLAAVLAAPAAVGGASGVPTARAAAAKLTVSPSVVPRGERVAIRGRGWAPGSRVKLSIGLPESDAYPIATMRANRRGRFVKRVRMRGLPALYVVVACPVGRCPRPVRATVRVVRHTKTRTLLHTDRPRSRYVERPRRVGYDDYATPAHVGAVTLSGLRWRRWGRGQAKAAGRARVCSAAGGDCETVGARVVATRRVRYESAEWFYARVVVRLRADAGLGTRRVVLCTLPALCGGKPGPP